MASRWCRWLIVFTLAALLAVPVPLAHAETPTPTDTPTETATPSPTPTGTPADETTITLDSGHQLVIERRWSFGELGIFLAILAHAALDGVLRIYELARREGREVQEVHIAH